MSLIREPYKGYEIIITQQKDEITAHLSRPINIGRGKVASEVIVAAKKFIDQNLPVKEEKEAE